MSKAILFFAVFALAASFSARSAQTCSLDSVPPKVKQLNNRADSTAKADSAKPTPAPPAMQLIYRLDLTKDEMQLLYQYINQDIYNEKGRAAYWNQLAQRIQAFNVPLK